MLSKSSQFNGQNPFWPTPKEVLVRVHKILKILIGRSEFSKCTENAPNPTNHHKNPITFYSISIFIQPDKKKQHWHIMEWKLIMTNIRCNLTSFAKCFPKPIDFFLCCLNFHQFYFIRKKIVWKMRESFLSLAQSTIEKSIIEYNRPPKLL